MATTYTLDKIHTYIRGKVDIAGVAVDTGRSLANLRVLVPDRNIVGSGSNLVVGSSLGQVQVLAPLAPLFPRHGRDVGCEGRKRQQRRGYRFREHSDGRDANEKSVERRMQASNRAQNGTVAYLSKSWNQPWKA